MSNVPRPVVQAVNEAVNSTAAAAPLTNRGVPVPVKNAANNVLRHANNTMVAAVKLNNHANNTIRANTSVQLKNALNNMTKSQSMLNAARKKLINANNSLRNRVKTAVKGMNNNPR